MRRVRGLSRISLSYNILPLFSADASIYVSFSPSYKPPFDKGRLFFRRPHAVVFPGETTAGEILVSTFPPNLPLPALRAASVTAPRHPASGCARLATRVTKGGFFPASPCRVVFPGEVTAGEILVSTFPPNLPLPALRAASVAAPRHSASGCARLATRVTKGGFFPTSPCRRISERNNSRRNPFPDTHEPSSCQKTGFAAAATSVASTYNDTGKSEKKRSERLFFRTKRPIFIPKVS